MTRVTATGLVLVAAFGLLAHAQQPQRPTFRSTASGVLVNAFVLKANVRSPMPVDGLTSANFELLDNGVTQTVDATPATGPIDLTVVVDGGGDAVRYYDEFRQTVRELASTLQPADRIRVLVCSGVVREAVPLQAASAPLAVDAIGQPNAPYGPALVHGLFDAMAREVDPERREVILGLGTFTGRDIFSPTALVSVASATDAVVYVAVEPTGTPIFPDVFQALGQIVSTTGGALMLAVEPGAGGRLPLTFRLPPLYGRHPDDGLPIAFKHLSEVMAMVLMDLRHGYVLSYSPPGGTTPGWHTLTVRVHKPGPDTFVVRARRRYFATPGGP